MSLTCLVTVSYNCFDWLKECIPSLQKHIPDIPIIVIDNNPSKDDSESRETSFKVVGSYKVRNYLTAETEAEREWLAGLSNVTVFRTPYNMHHGHAINFAIRCLSGYKIMVHIEPDCYVRGREWFDRLVQPIEDGMWMTSGYGIPGDGGALFITPSAWNLKKASMLRFEPCQKGDDMNHPLYKILIDETKVRDWLEIGWDTGRKAWFECAKEGKARFVSLNPMEFRHFWRGSIRKPGKELLKFKHASYAYP